MNLVDSCGWLEYFADGANADFFAPLIVNTTGLLVPAIVIYEVFKKLLLECDEEQALEFSAQLHQGNVVDFTEDIAINAAKISIEYSLPMADSIVLATAREYKAELYTQDKDFEHISGVKYIAKPIN